MRYNPDINAAAYEPAQLRARLTELQRLEFSPQEPESRARMKEITRIQNHLAQLAQLAGPASDRLRSYASRAEYDAHRP